MKLCAIVHVSCAGHNTFFCRSDGDIYRVDEYAYTQPSIASNSQESSLVGVKDVSVPISHKQLAEQTEVSNNNWGAAAALLSPPSS